MLPVSSPRLPACLPTPEWQLHILSGPEAGHQMGGLHQKLRETLRNRNPEAFDEECADEFDEFDYD